MHLKFNYVCSHVKKQTILEINGQGRSRVWGSGKRGKGKKSHSFQQLDDVR